MKANNKQSGNKNLSGTLSYSAITLVLLVIFIVPIPVILLDFLLSLNIVLSLLLVLDVFFSKKSKDYSLVPAALLMLTVLNLAINIIITRQILSFGEEFDGILICFIANPLTGDRFEGLIAACITFILCLAVYFIFIHKNVNHISRISASFTLDNMLAKRAVIETELKNGVITEKEAEERKNGVKNEADFYETLDGTCRFISVYEKLRLLFILLNSAGGFFIGNRLRAEMTKDAFETYIALTISSGILSLLPAVLLAVAIWIIVKRK